MRDAERLEPPIIPVLNVKNLGMTKYRKGAQRSITQDHRGSAIMRKLPDLQQFCLIFKNYFIFFCNFVFLCFLCEFWSFNELWGFTKRTF